MDYHDAEGASAPPDDGGKQSRGSSKKPPAKPIDFGKLGEMFDRYTLIYGTTDIWDAVERRMIAVQAFRLAYSGGLARMWTDSPQRKMLPQSAVVFDPARPADGLHINLFKGFGMQPKAGKCERLLALLRSMCGSDEVFEYIQNWMAYPLQHPGFKLRTALVFHGAQGVGKNLFWEAFAQIYGDHFSIIGQAQIEAKFNDWASGRLFVVADEVLTRAEMKNTNGTLKGLITQPVVQVEPKHTSTRAEDNRMNLVFFSNEAQPVPVEDGDRRWCVVWCDNKLSAADADAVAAERDSGGVAALYAHLMARDLTGFNPFGAPPVTEAKKNLQDIHRSSPLSFCHAWADEAIPHLPLVPARTTDLYEGYKRWCFLTGDKYPWKMQGFVGEVRRVLKMGRKRASVGANTKQVALAFPDGEEVWETMRDGATEGKFYGDYVEQFAAGVAEFKRSDLNGNGVHHAV